MPEDSIIKLRDSPDNMLEGRPPCSQSNNHGKCVQAKGHLGYREYRFCLCASCKLLDCHQQVLAMQSRLLTAEIPDGQAKVTSCQMDLDCELKVNLEEESAETITASSNIEFTPEAGEHSCTLDVERLLTQQVVVRRLDDRSPGASGRAAQVRRFISDAAKNDLSIKPDLLVLKLVLFSWYLSESCLVRYRWSAMNALGLTEAELSSSPTFGLTCSLFLVPLLCFLIDKTGRHRLALFLSMSVYTMSSMLMQVIAHNPELVFSHMMPASLFAFIVALQKVGIGLSNVLLDTATLLQTERSNASFGVQKLWVVLAKSLVTPIFDLCYPPTVKGDGRPSVDVGLFIFYSLAIGASLLTLRLNHGDSSALHARRRSRLNWIDLCMFTSSIFLVGFCINLISSFVSINLESRSDKYYSDNMITIYGALVSLPIMYCNEWILKVVGHLRSTLICLLLHLTLLVLLAGDRDVELTTLSGAAANLVTNFMWIAIVNLTYQISPRTLIATSQALVTVLVSGIGESLSVHVSRSPESFKLISRETLGAALVVFMLHNSFASSRSSPSTSTEEQQEQPGSETNDDKPSLQIVSTQTGQAQPGKVPLTALRVCLFCWFVVAIFLSAYMLKHMQQYVQMMAGSWSVISLTGMCLIELLSIPLVCFLAKQAGRSRLTLLLGLVSCVAVTFLVQSLVHEPHDEAGWSNSTHLLLFLLTMVLYQVATVLITLALDAMSGLLHQHDSRQPARGKLRSILVEASYPVGAVLLVSWIQEADKFVLLYLYAIFATVTIHTWNSLSLEISSSNVWVATSGPLLKTATIWLYVFAVFIMGSCAGFLATYLPDLLEAIHASEDSIEIAKDVAINVALPFLYNNNQKGQLLSAKESLHFITGVYMVAVPLDLFITDEHWSTFMACAIAEAFVLDSMWSESLRLTSQMGPTDRRENLHALARLLYYGLGLNFGAFFGGFIVKSHGIELSFIGLTLTSLIAASLYLLLHRRLARRDRERNPGSIAAPVTCATESARICSLRFAAPSS